MKIEEEYQGVLQNLEFILVQVYRNSPDMVDYDALAGINGLIRTYTAQTRKRKPPELRLKLYQQKAFDSVQGMCEVLLGNEKFQDEDGNPINIPIEIITLNELTACLKRIRKSIQLWQKKGGRRGYFEFVNEFLP